MTFKITYDVCANSWNFYWILWFDVYVINTNVLNSREWCFSEFETNIILVFVGFTIKPFSLSQFTRLRLCNKYVNLIQQVNPVNQV